MLCCFFSSKSKAFFGMPKSTRNLLLYADFYPILINVMVLMSYCGSKLQTSHDLRTSGVIALPTSELPFSYQNRPKVAQEPEESLHNIC